MPKHLKIILKAFELWVISRSGRFKIAYNEHFFNIRELGTGGTDTFTYYANFVPNDNLTK